MGTSPSCREGEVKTRSKTLMHLPNITAQVNDSVWFDQIKTSHIWWMNIRTMIKPWKKFYEWNLYEDYSEGFQPCNMKNRDIYWRRNKKHQTQHNDASVSFKVGTLGPHTVLPIAISCPVEFSWISLIVSNFFPFKSDFSFRKSQKSQATKSGL